MRLSCSSFYYALLSYLAGHNHNNKPHCCSCCKTANGKPSIKFPTLDIQSSRCFVLSSSSTAAQMDRMDRPLVGGWVLIVKLCDIHGYCCLRSCCCWRAEEDEVRVVKRRRKLNYSLTHNGVALPHLSSVCHPTISWWKSRLHTNLEQRAHPDPRNG